MTAAATRTARADGVRFERLYDAKQLVRFEIVPRDADRLLVLDHRRLPPAARPGYAAGWHAHLDVLAGA